MAFANALANDTLFALKATAFFSTKFLVKMNDIYNLEKKMAFGGADIQISAIWGVTSLNQEVFIF